MGVQYLYPLLVADATIATCRGWSVERTERRVFGSCSAACLGARARGSKPQQPLQALGSQWYRPGPAWWHVRAGPEVSSSQAGREAASHPSQALGPGAPGGVARVRACQPSLP